MYYVCIGGTIEFFSEMLSRNDQNRNKTYNLGIYGKKKSRPTFQFSFETSRIIRTRDILSSFDTPFDKFLSKTI